MRIAIFGGTSQIAKDFVLSSSNFGNDELILFSRVAKTVEHWLGGNGLSGRYSSKDYAEFETASPYDAIINFVGVGDPAKALKLGSAIFEITEQYDQLAIKYLRKYAQCRYIFMSSGAAYLSDFKEPANAAMASVLQLNQINHRDWYGISKMYAEARHRADPQLAIVDIRIFNYFSHTQDMSAAYFMTQAAQSIANSIILTTSSDPMVRDYLHPLDFYQLVFKIIEFPAINCAVDAYSKEPIDKATLLRVMESSFGLKYQISDNASDTNATGLKPFYYSENHSASHFGYKPQYSSLDGIKKELSLLLNKS
ncbi:NAD-dependent epimerase/dehydratase family protein [Polynucleobacter sp. AP-Latsch-80-C2]|jgi:nucleoside-diphosphate-sugar epimerase|uniref:NAD-dependent epimerase/dehydratase family protein n=1 Tax=Polynucleobacter sp. AP-Latsch-80-C2 TaxID=2576931 RepID=UPI001C0E2EE6|nr:NAD-dependent epimerase/dehydratase family protein [Polynucleobacter sp. AP-Latsch-80-C2]MBU3624387.1 NAD-dependent epimerase/dehydratase family protein [Polynucleobacter sp. AP-Latsch-80-C2]